jgi:hypothetical protein
MRPVASFWAGRVVPLVVAALLTLSVSLAVDGFGRSVSGRIEERVPGTSPGDYVVMVRRPDGIVEAVGLPSAQLFAAAQPGRKVRKQWWSLTWQLGGEHYRSWWTPLAAAALATLLGVARFRHVRLRKRALIRAE